MGNSNAGRIRVVSTIIIDPFGCCVKIVAQCLIAWPYVYAPRNLSSPVAQAKSTVFLLSTYSVFHLCHALQCVFSFTMQHPNSDGNIMHFLI